MNLRGTRPMTSGPVYVELLSHPPNLMVEGELGKLSSSRWTKNEMVILVIKLAYFNWYKKFCSFLVGSAVQGAIPKNPEKSTSKALRCTFF